MNQETKKGTPDLLVFYQLFRKYLKDHEQAASIYLNFFFQISSVDFGKISVPNIVSF